ncbi:MAG: DUF1573 domain-containing protein [Bacteroidota bacterium]
MKNWFLAILVLAFAFTACNQDTNSDEAEKSVTEVKNEKNLPNIESVRNPVTATVPEDTINVAKISFSEEIHDYGTVTAGEAVEHIFKFTNTGVAPLTITSAKSTCGCTVPDYPKEPIAPGAEGEIKVKFNTKGKSGRQKKPVRVTANTWPVETVVYIDGTVEKDPNAETADKHKGHNH